MKSHLTSKASNSLSAIAISLMLLTSSAFADSEVNHIKPESLCTPNEIIIFSCDIGIKKLSLCAINSDTDTSPTLIQYRFGKVGDNPELKYPSKPSKPLASFDYGTIDKTQGGPIETISFERPGAAYDVFATSESRYGGGPYAGVGVTVPGKPTKLLICEQGSVLVDLAPLRKAIGILPASKLREAIPKYPVEHTPFKITKQQRRCGTKCECKVEYPIISDSTVSSDIKSFINRPCQDGAKTDLSVSAKIINDTYLSVSYSDYTYHYGTPHGRTYEQKKTYKKGQNGWELISKEGLFDLSGKCRDRIDSLVYRQLKPLGLSRLESPKGLLSSAEIEMSSQGVIFSYGQYELGAYAEGPLPVLVPYKSLGSCLMPEK